MALNNTSQSDSNIDILYIKSKTKISLVLAIGGILSIISGELVLIMGSAEAGESLMKIGQVEISSKGAGSVVMATSVFWGYFSYLARPVYNRISEKSMARGQMVATKNYIEFLLRKRLSPIQSKLLELRMNDHISPIAR